MEQAQTFSVWHSQASRELELNQTQPQKYTYNYNDVQFYDGAVRGRTRKTQPLELGPVGLGQERLPVNGARRVNESH